MTDAAATRFTAHDLYLFREGSHVRLHEKLGAHLAREGGRDGVRFGVWAPNAARVSVVGDFNGWQPGAHPLAVLEAEGVWEGFVPELGQGALYKLHVESARNEYRADKSDPFAFHREAPPGSASIVWPLDGHEWGDGEWMRTRKRRNALDAPMSVYEVHLGSWRRIALDHGGSRFPSYRELADTLVPYVAERGFTHVELMPLCEHPYYASWGYQATGYFAPTSRYGTPQDLMHLVERFHQAGVGVILDWVPSHFPSDEHGLSYFDGTHLYEHPDPRRGYQPDWKSYVFDYGRGEVQSFLISNALYWLERYHFDGLRVDAVASMLYLDYSRQSGEWAPNVHGGREHLEAIDFLRRFNQEVYAAHPDVQTIAEESTAWPLVSRPPHDGGLGFGLKWDMGWMHDSLRYFARDPLFRKHDHRETTFRSVYAFHENFVLPLSHDEVVHGKGSLLGKMPGSLEHRFANLRLLLAWQHAQPGKKLLFMGGELGQWKEWDHDGELDWALEGFERHAGVQRLVTDLNRLHRERPELHELDTDSAGFEWIDADDSDQSVLSFLRKDRAGREVLVVLNMTPIERQGYRVGVPRPGPWRELLSTDAEVYGGGGGGNPGQLSTHRVAAHDRKLSLELTLPPLAALFLCRDATPAKPRRKTAAAEKPAREPGAASRRK